MRGLLTSTTRLMFFATELAVRRAIVSLERGPFSRWRWPGATPERLVIAPQDIRTADPTIAADIYAGVFAFAGKVIETSGRSPFDLEAPSECWARQLHSFGWLRHLRAADNALARQNARALVADWINQEAKAPPLAFATEILAQRVIAWVTQSPLILEEADRGFYRRFVRSLVRQVRRLRIRFFDAPDGYPRLIAAIAVAEFALSVEGQQRLIRQASQRLEQELVRQVLPDGGHVSRQPGVIVDILTELLPLRQAYATRGVTPPAALVSSIDRMMPMLRFFRHADGHFAHFNGMGASQADQLATLHAYDDTRGVPVQNASHSGYQRLDAAGTVVLMDTGAIPPLGVSQHAHAGCLSFEMSSGGHRFIINCGSSLEPRWRDAARSTPAHSTLVLEDASSASFLDSGRLARRIGTVMPSGARQVLVKREDRAEGTVVAARHDGYAAAFAAQHERSLTLSADGAEILGTDRVLMAGRSARQDRFAIRFHLHPSIRATRTAGGDVLLLAPDGEAWTFSCPMIPPELEDSVYLSDVHGRRKTLQIVLPGRARVTPEVHWTLSRTALGQRSRASKPREAVAGVKDLFEL
ncbi:heparinase II/III family protein [Oryzibacter oryziterrae]|uniref:heparinase II/III family protein n=1 Tax=Oryzibacter oryziterrae TaxID=2766474 RepID=UPI001F01009A|nr:heparinase II/III family protein [Oryzibacter oryziterrae]